LAVSVEAGLGLDGAMLEVVNRWNNALSDEFAIVLAELKMGRSRREALRGLADRTGVEEVKVFTSAMVQADELGMGVARPLTLQADQLRLKRRQFAEQKAREAGIKMVVTMGLLIMPALFLIIVSPAVVQIGKVFKLH
ncbi:MAG TPA: type II secretion system F family protein, partial [Thermomicrobiaceae bacterium]|nr:type II secretion system F family protein [Thermomicrobiaceae bacterium]